MSRTEHGARNNSGYQYDEQGLLAGYDAAGTLTGVYGWQPQGLWGTDPVFLADVAHSGDSTYWTVHYYHTDHLGSPQVLTDQAGELSWRGLSEAFGQTVADPQSRIDNPLRFPGQYHDAETGLNYNYVRDYQPTPGRYVQADPIGLRGA